MTDSKHIWIFHGSGGRFASGVFENKELAETWVKKYHLQGILTKYLINEGVYDWANRSQYFKPSKAAHLSSDFIQKFSLASQEHYHYEDD